jgi:hypothetical protein
MRSRTPLDRKPIFRTTRDIRKAFVITWADCHRFCLPYIQPSSQGCRLWLGAIGTWTEAPYRIVRALSWYSKCILNCWFQRSPLTWTSKSGCASTFSVFRCPSRMARSTGLKRLRTNQRSARASSSTVFRSLWSWCRKPCTCSGVLRRFFLSHKTCTDKIFRLWIPFLRTAKAALVISLSNVE